jgi:hypothetical protein
MAITAQTNTNRYGATYTYYRCTKKSVAGSCGQRSIRAEELERQIVVWLEGLDPGSKALENFSRAFEGLRRNATQTRRAIRESVEAALRRTRSQLAELLKVRIAGLVGDDEYGRLRAELLDEEADLARKLDDQAQPEEWLKPLPDAIALCKQAVDWWRSGDDDMKRRIVKSTGSNLTLIDKTLSIEAAKWLQCLGVLPRFPIRLGECGDVETFDDFELSRTLPGLRDDPHAWAQLMFAARTVDSAQDRPCPAPDIQRIDRSTSPTSPISRRQPSARPLGKPRRSTEVSRRTTTHGEAERADALHMPGVRGVASSSQPRAGLGSTA